MADREATQGTDLSLVWRGLRRRWLWILGSTLLIALLTYMFASSRPPVYQASATLIATNSSQGSEDVLGSGLVKAPPLPPGVLDQALGSTLVLERLIQDLSQELSIPVAERTHLINSLSEEMRDQELQTVSLTSQVDLQGNGLYSIQARARSTVAAEVLANLAARSLRSWDQSRALENIRSSLAGFSAQLSQIDTQLAQPGLSGVERQTLIARRASVQGSLAQVGILESSATGVLSLLSSAVAPRSPIAPKPLRTALTAGLLTLLLAAGVAALLTLADRTVRQEDDLLSLGLPTLAILPRLRQRDVLFSGIVRAARQQGLYEAIGFLRVNLLNAVQGRTHPVVLVTSTAPKEGKSTTTATLADGFASSGLRVLIVDADLRRGTQEDVWRKYDQHGQWHQLVGEGGVRSTREALLQPENVQVIQVEERVDMLPAGPGVQDTLAILNQADIRRAFELWQRNYDIVLVDSAPLLALADGLVLGVHTDAVVMVTEYGQTTTAAVRQAVRRAERAGLNLIGFVINKADQRDGGSYNYNYSYSPRQSTRV